MKKLFALTTLSVLTLITGAASAQEPAPAAQPPAGGAAAPPAKTEDGEMPGSESGLRFGARLGYQLPLGDAAESSPLSDAVGGGVPIWLDIGYRINRNIYIGGTFNYAFLGGGDKGAFCPTGADCSASQIRFGVMGAYHILPTAQFDPWIGVGLGYEILNLSASAGGKSVDFSVTGIEFLNLQLGGDYRATENIRVGPFAAFSLGQYSSVSSGGNSADITKTGLHQWLTLGVRGAYDL
jgi:hypothetical protein